MIESPRGWERDGKVGAYSGTLVRDRGAPGWRIAQEILRAVQRRLEGLRRGKEGLTECRGETLQVRVLAEPETESWGLKKGRIL